MEIEYIYPDSKDEKELASQIKRIKKENTINNLIGAITLLSIFFIFLALLPIILTIIGYTILILGFVVIYKMYLESPILNLLQKYNLRHK